MLQSGTGGTYRPHPLSVLLIGLTVQADGDAGPATLHGWARVSRRISEFQKVVAAGREKLMLMPEYYTYALRLKSLPLRAILRLHAQLRTCSRHWLAAFVQTGGLHSLLEMLRKTDEVYVCSLL